MMDRASKLASIIGPIVIGVVLVGISCLSLKVSTALSAPATFVQPPSEATLGPAAFLPPDNHQGTLILPFSDEFEDSELDRTKWEVLKGNPLVDNGNLILPGDTTRAEIQSNVQFQSGMLQTAIASSDWKPQDQATDTSFGLELWTGVNGQCHYGVIFIANGHLGVLRSQPDGSNNCSGDPAEQVYVPISNWEVIRAAGTVYLTLTWSPDGIILRVSDGGSNSGQALYPGGEANPVVPLKIRLNADVSETYAIDYVRMYPLVEGTVLVDDSEPQPQQGGGFWPHNRLGGDRGPINVMGGTVVWGQGVVTATITSTTPTGIGVWTALNHPIADHNTIDFAALFPPQIKPEFQGHITGLQIEIGTGTGTFQVEFKAPDPVSPATEISKWQETALLTGTPLTLNFTLPLTLGEVQNLNWLVNGTQGDEVVVDRVAFTVTLPQLELPERAFLWSYAMLLNNWDPASGLTRDHAYWSANKFDNVSASGMQAAAAVLAWQQGFITQAAATEIVTKTSEALLALPECHGLWPHFVANGQIISGTEWSSIDTVIARVALIEAREALGLDPDDVGQALADIDWEDLTVEIGGVPYLSHGYITDCSSHIQAGDEPAVWKDFGTESWLVNFGYAAATSQVAEFDHTPPTVNGSGFIDELAWLLIPRPCRDQWDTNWCAYSRQAADSQIAYYLNHACYSGPPQLFGLSAAEVPDLSTIPIAESAYRAFGIGGETPAGDPVPPNDGRTDERVGHAVIVPHYAALIASLRPTQTLTLWDWIEKEGLFTPLNNVESFMVTDEPICEDRVWNALKGSWNLSLQTLGWGRLLAGDDYPLYQGLRANRMLQKGYRVMTAKTCPPYVYYGVHVPGWLDNLEGLAPFENDAKKKASIVMWYQGWGLTDGTQYFQPAWMDNVRNHGSIPLVTWEPWLYTDPGGTEQPQYQLGKIINGDFDPYIETWANASKSWGHPYFLRFAAEMNGDWFPWSEQANGNSPGEYVQAWRHVHDLFATAGVTNVTWVWSPNIEYTGSITLEDLYPGDAYVDWLGMDGYNWGTVPHRARSVSWQDSDPNRNTSDTGWQTFSGVFSPTYSHLLALSSKPLMIAEMASAEQGGSKADWITDAYAVQIPDNFEKIKAVIWFNEDKETDWRIESPVSAQDAFATAIQSSYYATNQYAALSASPIPIIKGWPCLYLPLASKQTAVEAPSKPLEYLRTGQRRGDR